MSEKNKTKKLSHTLGKGFLPAVSIMTFAVVGASILALSHAATGDNPVGSIDYCTLENNVTTIYGWASDGQAAGTSSSPYVTVKVGSYTSPKLPTNRDYKESAIDSYLSSRGMPTASHYGFRTQLTSTVYQKGSAPTISGTIYNVGVGANQPINVYAGTATSKSSGANYYFPGGKVPDGCLPAKPAPPAVPPPNNPPANPNPVINTPPPSQNTKSGGTKTGTGSNTSSTSTTGTNTTTDQTTTTANSYNLTLKLVNKDQAVPNTEIKLVEADLKITTDDNGNAVFPGLSETSYTVQFDYQSNSYEQTIGIGSEEAKSGSVSQTIDISQLAASDSQGSDTANTPVHKKSHVGVIVFVILVIAGIAGAALLVIRRRRATGYDSPSSDYSYPLPLPPVVDTTPTYTAPKTHTTPTAQPSSQDGAGVSLKEMVIKSMREEAARRKDGQS